MQAMFRFFELGGAVVLTLLMGVVFLAGIKKIAIGAWSLIASDEAAAGIASLLKGIEYFFLAPLLLLAYISMVMFVRTALPGGLPRTHIQLPDSEHSSSSLVFLVKKSMAALMIAILLTDLVDQALADSTATWLALTAECFGIVLSGGYLLLLTRTDHR